MTEKYVPENSIATLLKYAAFIVGIGGAFASLLMGKALSTVQVAAYSWEKSTTHYNWSVAISGLFLSVVVFLLIYGFGEIVNLLQRNLDAQNALAAQLRQPEEPQKNDN